MVREGGACDACARNCDTFHQKQKDLSPIVTRFFKAVFDEDYSKALYLPSKFARRVKHLAGQETQIEDSNGQRWSVTLSYVEGSLAFQEGWNKFFIDHGLKVGDLLIFNYVKGSHFVVQIYGKSSCERINFNKEKSRERKRLKRDPQKVSVDEPFLTTDVALKLKPSSAASVASGSECQNRQTHLVEANANFAKLQMLPVPMDMEDPACLINRDDEFHRREERDFLFDLSSFEMKKETLDTNKIGEALNIQVAPCLAETTEQTEAKGDDTQMDATHANEIDGHSNDILADKSEKALDPIIDPSHSNIAEESNVKVDDTKKMDVMDVNQNAEVFMDKVEKVVDTEIAPPHTGKVAMMDVNQNAEVFMDKAEKVEDTKIAPPHTEKVAVMDVNQDAEVCMDRVEKVVDTKIAPPHTEKVAAMDVNQNAEVYMDRVEKVVDTNIAPPHTEKVAVMDVNQNAEVFMDKVDKVVDTKIVPPHTEIKEQKKTKGDDTEMTAIRRTLINGHSVDLFTDKCHIKPSDNINLSKDAMGNNSNSRNGNNNVLQSNSDTPSISSGKIAERKYVVKRRCRESTVSSSALKDPFGKHAINKEPAELGEKANRLPGVSSGKEPVSVRKRGRPVVKAEPDLPYDTVPSDAVRPFSAKVKSQYYLELPVHLPSIPGKRERGRGKVVYVRDPAGRIWPLLYPEIFSMKALTGNWRIFCEKNRIKPGDECRFRAENEKLCLYRVDIVRNFSDN